MGNVLRVCTAALALVALTAPVALAQRGRAQSAGTIEAGQLRFEGIGPQNLTPGMCGLFLWARASLNPVLIAAAFDTTGEMVMRINGRERRLQRTAFEGANQFGHFAKTTYEDRNAHIELEVSFDTSRPIQDGAMVERAVLRVRDDEDWESVIPVGGMAACQR